MARKLLNHIENLWSIPRQKRRVDKQKPTDFDKLQALIMQVWATISQDVNQKLIDIFIKSGHQMIMTDCMQNSV